MCSFCRDLLNYLAVVAARQLQGQPWAMPIQTSLYRVYPRCAPQTRAVAYIQPEIPTYATSGVFRTTDQTYDVAVQQSLLSVQHSFFIARLKLTAQLSGRPRISRVHPVHVPGSLCSALPLQVAEFHRAILFSRSRAFRQINTKNIVTCMYSLCAFYLNS